MEFHTPFQVEYGCQLQWIFTWYFQKCTTVCSIGFLPYFTSSVCTAVHSSGFHFCPNTTLHCIAGQAMDFSSVYDQQCTAGQAKDFQSKLQYQQLGYPALNLNVARSATVPRNSFPSYKPTGSPRAIPGLDFSPAWCYF